MADCIFLMHDDSTGDDEDWEPCLRKLQQAGVFQGGSAIGDGACATKGTSPPPVTAHLARYIRVTADSLKEAKSLLAGNPVFEAGGTVEIRELPRTE